MTWMTFTGPFINAISEAKPLVWIMWGDDAQKVEKEIKGNGHVLIKSAHPAARAGATSPFAESDSFRKANTALVNMGKKPIDWKLDN